jgi:DNA-binding CsgD family transcriptional regulator
MVWGRDAELERVRHILDTAGDDPFALVIGGAEGIGKTTVWKTAVSLATERGRRVLTARPVESEATFAFAAVADLLRDSIDEALGELPAPQRSALEAALLRADVETPPDPKAVAFALYASLVALAGATPLLVAIDDVQWLDGPSARVLGYAFRRLDGSPVGLVLASRSPVDEGEAPLRLDTSPIGERLERMPLGPLDLDATREILATRLATRFPRWMLLEIHRASSGHPLLALELARALERHGVDVEPGHPLPIPNHLAALLGDRLDALPDDVRWMLLLVAAAARPTRTSIAAAVGDAEGLETMLAFATDADILERPPDRLRFSNPLIGAALLSRSPPETRRRAHGVLAEVATEPEERVRHLAHAADGADEDVARQLEDAAQRARSRGAPDAAAELAELSLLVTPDDEIEACTRRTSNAGRYAFESGSVGRAEELLQKAAASARGPMRAEALLYLSRVHYHRRDTASAAALAEEALAEAEEDPSLQASINLELAAAAELSGDHQTALERARGAVALAERSTDRTITAEALSLLAYFTFLSGEGFTPDAYERAKALEVGVPAARPLRSPAFHEALTRMRSDDLDGAREGLRALEARARESGDESSISIFLAVHSELESWAGDYRAASTLADEARRVAEWTGQRVYAVMATYAGSLAAASRGDVPAADALARESLALAEQTGARQPGEFARGVLGALEVAKGDVAAAHAWLSPLIDSARERGASDPGVLRFLPDEIEALIALGESERAEELLVPFEAGAERLGRAWAIGAAARCRGLLLAGRRRVDDAVVAFDRALEVQDKLGQPLEVGRTLLAKGVALRRGKKWAGARTTLSLAVTTFSDLGADLWADRARDELGRVGGRATALDELTETEDQVARLVATGLSNREVAARLFVSVSTVESNLGRAFRKLGVRSRAQLSHKLGADATDRP